MLPFEGNDCSGHNSGLYFMCFMSYLTSKNLKIFLLKFMGQTIQYNAEQYFNREKFWWMPGNLSNFAPQNFYQVE